MANINKLVNELLSEGIIENHFGGDDKQELENIKMKIKAGIKSEYDRQKALEEINDLIDNSNRIFTYHSFTSWLTALGIDIVTLGLGNFIRIAFRISNSRNRQAFRNELVKLHSEVQSIKIKK